MIYVYFSLDRHTIKDSRGSQCWPGSGTFSLRFSAFLSRSEVATVASAFTSLCRSEGGGGEEKVLSPLHLPCLIGKSKVSWNASSFLLLDSVVWTVCSPGTPRRLADHGTGSLRASGLPRSPPGRAHPIPFLAGINGVKVRHAGCRRRTISTVICKVFVIYFTVKKAVKILSSERFSVSVYMCGYTHVCINENVFYVLKKMMGGNFFSI